jgi:hypothetical protein
MPIKRQKLVPNAQTLPPGLAPFRHATHVYSGGIGAEVNIIVGTQTTFIIEAVVLVVKPPQCRRLLYHPTTLPRVLQKPNVTRMPV